MVLPIKQLDNLLDFIEFQSIRHEEEAEVEYATHQEYDGAKEEEEQHHQ